MKAFLLILSAVALLVGLCSTAEAGPFVRRSKSVVVQKQVLNGAAFIAPQAFLAPQAQAFIAPQAIYMQPQAFVQPQALSLGIQGGVGYGGVQSFRSVQRFSAGGNGCGALLIR